MMRSRNFEGETDPNYSASEWREEGETSNENWDDENEGGYQQAQHEYVDDHRYRDYDGREGYGSQEGYDSQGEYDGRGDGQGDYDDRRDYDDQGDYDDQERFEGQDGYDGPDGYENEPWVDDYGDQQDVEGGKDDNDIGGNETVREKIGLSLMICFCCCLALLGAFLIWVLISQGGDDSTSSQQIFATEAPSAVPEPGPAPTIFPVEADTSLKDGIFADQSFSTQPWLELRAGDNNPYSSRALLSFDISDLPQIEDENIFSSFESQVVLLRLSRASNFSSSEDITVSRMELDDSTNVDLVTWNDLRGINEIPGPTITVYGYEEGAGWFDIDITDLVRDQQDLRASESLRRLQSAEREMLFLTVRSESTAGDTQELFSSRETDQVPALILRFVVNETPNDEGTSVPASEPTSNNDATPTIPPSTSAPTNPPTDPPTDSVGGNSPTTTPTNTPTVFVNSDGGNGEGVTTTPPTNMPTMQPSSNTNNDGSDNGNDTVTVTTTTPTGLPTASPSISNGSGPTDNGDNDTVTTTPPTGLPTASPSTSDGTGQTDNGGSDVVATTPPTGSPSLSPSSSGNETVPISTGDTATAPTVTPTGLSSISQTVAPTSLPTSIPTGAPSLLPTAMPTVMPTAMPTAMPTVPPTAMPTGGPTVPPTLPPTEIECEAESCGAFATCTEDAEGVARCTCPVSSFVVPIGDDCPTESVGCSGGQVPDFPSETCVCPDGLVLGGDSGVECVDPCAATGFAGNPCSGSESVCQEDPSQEGGFACVCWDDSLVAPTEDCKPEVGCRDELNPCGVRAKCTEVSSSEGITVECQCEEREAPLYNIELVDVEYGVTCPVLEPLTCSRVQCGKFATCFEYSSGNRIDCECGDGSLVGIQDDCPVESVVCFGEQELNFELGRCVCPDGFGEDRQGYCHPNGSRCLNNPCTGIGTVCEDDPTAGKLFQCVCSDNSFVGRNEDCPDNTIVSCEPFPCGRQAFCEVLQKFNGNVEISCLCDDGTEVDYGVDC